MYKQILLISLLLAPLAAKGQTADDYFHRGAQLYIHGKKQDAKTEIETGLRRYPNDPVLRQLAVLLKKEEKEQKQQQQNGQQNEDQNKSQENKDKNGESQQKQDSQDKKKDTAKEKSDQEKQQEKQQAEQSQAKNQKDEQQKQQEAEQNQASGEPKDKSQEEAQREAAMMAAGEMTPQQAKQLLDAQKDDEHVLQLAPPNKQTSQSRPFKNW